MSTPLDTNVPPAWWPVHLREYSERIDLSGKDLISMLTRPKEEVSRLVGTMVAKSEMQTEELPGEYVTSLTGEVADEIHEWPHATLGTQFRHLILQFREGRLINMIWKFQAGTLPRSTKPWWRFW
jgi:hypothetical protein